MPSLRSELRAATSLLSLAQRLGAICIEHEEVLMRLRGNPDVELVATNLEEAVEAIEAEAFERCDATDGFEQILALNDIEERIQLAETHPPVDSLAFLRGLCRRALPDFFLGTEACLQLDAGMPVPSADRPVHGIYGRATPHHTTLKKGTLMEDLPYTLFDHSAKRAIHVELDYGSRGRLDDLTWLEEGRLPRIATVHPPIERDGIDSQASAESGSFFDVRPRHWNLDEVLAQLEDVAGQAEIAVLPELCMPGAAVEPFGQALAAAPERYPPLVVAGSAHVRQPGGSGSREIRTNESRVYLDGRQVAVHHKVHPFATKMLGVSMSGGPLLEAITPGPKKITVLAGRFTHLAVVICSDLVDFDVPRLLNLAAVNLLLVPSLTFEQGSFNGAICDLASYRQGICVIVNANLDRLAKTRRSRPFRVMAAAPEPDNRRQSRSFPSWIGPRRSLGVLDPNRGLRRAMRWV